MKEKLRARLALVGELRCSEHGAPVAAVTIDPCENGWFDARWTTCCESLHQAAAAILGKRC